MAYHHRNLAFSHNLLESYYKSLLFDCYYIIKYIKGLFLRLIIIATLDNQFRWLF